MGIFEKDLSASTLLAVPELYTKGQRNGGFNFKVYLGWMFMASAEAMVIYFCMLGLYGQALFTEDNSIFALGSITFTSCVILINTKLQYVSPPFPHITTHLTPPPRFIETHSKTATNAAALLISIGGWFLWNMILASAYPLGAPIYPVRAAFFTTFGRSLPWWLTLLLILTSIHVLEFAASSLRAAFLPTDEDVFQALEKDPDVKRRFEEAAAEELQLGWDRATNGEKRREDAVRGVVDLMRRKQEDYREEQVREMLRNREGREREAGRGTIGEEMGGEEVDRILSRGYGHVREE